MCSSRAGGYILLTLGNGVFNGIRLFMCAVSVAFLDWLPGASEVGTMVEQPDASLLPAKAPAPRFISLIVMMGLAWSQVAISVAVGTACMDIIANSTTITDIILK